MDSVRTLNVRVDELKEDVDKKADREVFLEKLRTIRSKTEEVRNLAEEAKIIALSSKNKPCQKEKMIEDLGKNLEDCKVELSKIVTERVSLAEEMGKWKWFRALLIPITLAIVTTAASGYTLISGLEKDVGVVVHHQKESENKIEKLADSQKELMVVVERREKELIKTDKSMEHLIKAVNQVVENTTPKKRKR